MLHVRTRQETRSGREGAPLSTWLWAGGLQNAAMWAAVGIMASCTLHAKILGLGLSAEENQPMVLPAVVPRSRRVAAGWLWLQQASAPSCSSLWRLLSNKFRGKNLKTVSHNAALSSKKCWCECFPSKTKDLCLFCPTWNSAVRLKEKGFEEGFQEKWINKKNLGDQMATSGEQACVLALGYLTFVDLHWLLFSVNSWAELN